MAAKSKQREKRVASARRRVTEHQSGNALGCLILPEGATLFQVKKAGTFRLDILPYEVKATTNPFAKPGELHYERTYWCHSNIGPDNGKYVCLSKTLKKPCPICEFRAKLARDPDADEKLVKELAPKERQLFNLIDLSDSEKGPQIFEYSHFLFGKPLDAKVRAADDNEYDLFADLEQGLTLKVTFEEEKGGGYSFYKASDMEFKPRKKPYGEDILDQVFDLDSLLKETPYAELKKIFLQEDPDDEDEDEDDEEEKVPAPKKGAKSKTTPVAVPDDDDDDDDEDEEDEANAADLGIVLGSTVEHKKHGQCKVVHVSGDGSNLRLETEDGKTIRAVSPSDVSLVDNDEEEEDPDEEFTVGDLVKFEYRNKELTGTVTKIDAKKGLAYVKVGGKTDPSIVKLEELELVEEEDQDDEEDEEPAPKKKGAKPEPTKKGKAPAKGKKSKDDDEEDEDDSDDDDDDWED